MKIIDINYDWLCGIKIECNKQDFYFKCVFTDEEEDNVDAYNAYNAKH